MGNEEQKKIFSKNLKMWLAIRQISQKDLAEKFGWSASSITEWISGRKYPRMDKIQALADYLGILKSDLIDEKVFSVTEQDKELNDLEFAFAGEAKKLSKEDKEDLLKIMIKINSKK